MTALLWLVLILGQPPTLGPIITVQQRDGSWKCSSTCRTSGNADGGSCHTLIPGRGPTEEACKAQLADTCAKTKPPAGGCHVHPG